MASSSLDLAAFRARKVALIYGISGQAGSYLAELLLRKGYKVHGVTDSPIDPFLIERLCDPDTHAGDASFSLHYGYTDPDHLSYVVSVVKPSEVYNLAALSHNKDEAEFSDSDFLHDAIAACGLTKKVRFLHTSKSELYAKAQTVPQKETTPFGPRADFEYMLDAHQVVVRSRERCEMFASTGVVFNHDSPRSDDSLLSRKITSSVAKISLGQQDFFKMGNLDSVHEWGHTKEYVKGMWRILQNDAPDDFILATGRAYTVRHFCELAFAEIGQTIVWEGEGMDEVGRDKATGALRVYVSSKYYRPTKGTMLIGDATKAKTKLGWEAKIMLKQLVKEMVATDIKRLKVTRVPAKTTLIAYPPVCTVPAAGGTSTDQLANPRAERVVFKIKATNWINYRVKPSHGFVEPGDTSPLEVTRKPGVPTEDELVVLFAVVASDAADAKTAFEAAQPSEYIRLPVYACVWADNKSKPMA